MSGPEVGRAWEALRPILRAGAGALNRATALDIRCPQDHRRCRVFRTAAGLVLQGKGRMLADDSPTRNRVTDIAVMVLPDVPLPVSVQCRCAGDEIPTGWILSKIAAGGGRVVWPPA